MPQRSIPGMLRLRGEFALSGALVLAALLPVQAYIAPTVLFERSRVARVLTDEQRERAHQLGTQQPSTASLDGYRDAMLGQLQPTDPPLAFELYADVAHMELREKVLAGYEARAELLVHAQEALQGYLRHCHAALRSSRKEGLALADLGERSPTPQLAADQTGVRIYRFMPWPEPYGPEDQRRLQAAAEQDLQLAREQHGQALRARLEYSRTQHDWSARLQELTLQSAAHSEGWLKLQRAGNATGKR